MFPGHNGLVCAAYLQKAGCKVCVLERRHVVGGAAVTEEIIPGYKFSRASYVLSLLRPQIYADLQLEVFLPFSVISYLHVNCDMNIYISLTIVNPCVNICIMNNSKLSYFAKLFPVLNPNY